MSTILCPESIYGFHGPCGKYGVCPWCKQKVSYTVVFEPEPIKSDIDASYEYFYDPDFGSRKEDKY